VTKYDEGNNSAAHSKEEDGEDEAKEDEDEDEQDSKDKIIRVHLEKQLNGIFGLLTRKFIGILSVITSITFMFLT
jgi:hypothetical protein